MRDNDSHARTIHGALVGRGDSREQKQFLHMIKRNSYFRFRRRQKHSMSAHTKLEGRNISKQIRSEEMTVNLRLYNRVETTGRGFVRKKNKTKNKSTHTKWVQDKI